jgi:hypothetical protein
MEQTSQTFTMGVSTVNKPKKSSKKKVNQSVVTEKPFSCLIEPMYRFARYPWLLTNPKDPIALLAIVQAVNPTTKETFNTIIKILLFLVREHGRQKGIMSSNLCHPFRINFPGTQAETLESIKNAINHVIQNQKQLMAFRKLALRWLETRRLKAGNEEDLLTGEAPITPITLTVWAERRKYVFEPDTIRRDMIERLFQHSYLFPKYCLPRNPYTNCELTPHQFYSIMKQLRAVGKTHWLLEALYKSKYDINIFKNNFDEPLKRELIQRIFNNPFSPDAIDIVLDFIDDIHHENKKYYDHALYRWAFEHKSKHRRIKRWIQLCKDYQLLIIGYNDNFTERLKLIKNACVLLCEHPKDIEAERNVERKEKGLSPITLASEVSDSDVSDSDVSDSDVSDAVTPIVFNANVITMSEWIAQSQSEWIAQSQSDWITQSHYDISFFQ